MPTQRALIGATPDGNPAGDSVPALMLTRSSGHSAYGFMVGASSGCIRSILGSSESSVMTMGAMTAATKPASTHVPAIHLTTRRELTTNTATAIATIPRSISELTHQGHHQSSRIIAKFIRAVVRTSRGPR
jgi:hypothetical protein